MEYSRTGIPSLKFVKPLPAVTRGNSRSTFIMRAKASILAFIITLTGSLALTQRHPVIEWLWPSFTRAEVAGKVGRRVRYRSTEEFRGMKCPEDGVCKEIQNGERGTIIDLYPVANG